MATCCLRCARSLPHPFPGLCWHGRGAPPVQLPQPSPAVQVRGAIIHVIGDFVQSVGVAIAGGLIWWHQVGGGPSEAWREREGMCRRAQGGSVGPMAQSLAGPISSRKGRVGNVHAQTGTGLPRVGAALPLLCAVRELPICHAAPSPLR